MDSVLVTGSSGLVGEAASRLFHSMGYRVIGIDNNMRAEFFGEVASTDGAKAGLIRDLKNFHHFNIDIRNHQALENVFRENKNFIKGVIHCAAQPSHDWAAKNPRMDFDVNAVGTVNLLELTRKHNPESFFIFMSTNKVYGEHPNRLIFREEHSRWSPIEANVVLSGIDENMSIDQTVHSVFGVSKVAADLMVQEYGRYFDMNTVVFRGGCLTGPSHAGAELHGFLSYMVKCAISGAQYQIFGYKGKQVRDNIHSEDLAKAFLEFSGNPRKGEVYNIGGGPGSDISLLEAIDRIQLISGKNLHWTQQARNRIGDHIWYVSNISKFKRDYPSWKMEHNIDSILEDIVRGEHDH